MQAPVICRGFFVYTLNLQSFNLHISMNKLLSIIHGTHPVIMGILNTTPDSFSDGGQFVSVENALHHALQMVQQGADIIDIGGESTRPGAQDVSVEDELQRVIPVIEAVRRETDVCLSIDTSKPEVMRAAVAAGVDLVNDVYGLRAEGAVEVCAELDVAVCIMHMQGEPRTMQQSPEYSNVLEDVAGFLQARVDACLAQGIEREKIILDPGFGFGKNLQHNLSLLKGLGQIHALGYPLLVGLSRKSMLGLILDGAAADQRLSASIAAAVLAWSKGARIFRVHDVKQTKDALAVCQAMEQ